MIRKVFAAVCATAAILLIASCSSDTNPTSQPRNAPPDPNWVSAISLHTNGAVSRHAPIRVLFINGIVPESRIGSDASANIAISPKVKARATFAGRREIILRPETEFAANAEYRVKVLAQGLTGVAAETRPFEFTVKTLEVNFEVYAGTLNVEPGHSELMTLYGSINTADSEPREALEKILSATLDGKAIAVNWIGGDRSFQFTVPNILRRKQEQELVLHWDGAPLGLEISGEKSTRVPALDEFAVTQADAVEENNQRRIQVHFSDALDTRQDLKGLIRLSQGEFTTRIDNNLLTLYLNEGASGKITLTLEEGLHARSGNTLSGERQFELEFKSTRPQLRFVGSGVILPDSKTLSIPFEAVSLRAVRVTALEVFETSIPQFLQVNPLSGMQELGRVGRVLWRKTIPLTSQVQGRWTRYNLDVTELTQKHPGALFQLTISMSPRDADWKCAGTTDTDALQDPQPATQLDADGIQPSNWDNGYGDGGEDYYENEDGDVRWEERDDPCKAAYYRYAPNIRASRNLLASNIGLIAKRGPRGKLLVAATALDSARPKAGIKVDLLSFQNQVLASGRTDANGMVELDPRTQPFAVIADDAGRKGYLRVATGLALPVSHFDVGGESVVNGLKGFIYGDRGVWRPGDAIYLTFALQDRARTLPPNHPVTLELRDPRGQLVQTLTNTKPVGDFYAFELKTAADAPTGDWHATATIGGASFAKTVKVETVMPNRLKIELDLGEKPVISSSPLKGGINAQWLSGATAANLRAAVELRLSPTATQFTRFADFEFDDPSRTFNGAPLVVFDKPLDADGHASFESDLDLPKDAPGMLNATFVTRVFERGGAFSIGRESRTVAAFQRYVGLKMPKGDAARDMLLTDTTHTVELASVDIDGKPVSVPRLQVTLYKLQWRWWWDSTGDSLAQYAQGQSTDRIRQDTVATKDGRGQWQFEIKYPEWGRYLVRACDLDGGHCTGRVFYIDWPSWAGQAREQSGPAANVLMITSDKPEYKVGETAMVQLPEAAQGRALLTLENGSSVLDYRWIEATAKPGANRIEIPITAGMAPNVYVAVTMVQPHAGKENDRPIRLYGVMPLKVTDPATRLSPVVTSAAEWAPKSRASVTVSESGGRPMDYTLAIVDEGLLGLTGFKTPNLFGEFYKREALGVSTWDLFDDVAGAYGGELDRLLALGGSDASKPTNPDEGKSRFPPVVRFLGPFSLKAGEKRVHDVTLPEYVGSVRVMVVAGNGTAYGSAEKSVFVRQALMILPTLPRVIGPEEQFRLPVSVFTSEASIRDVKLSVDMDARFTAVGEPSTSLSFSHPEEKLGFLTIKSGSQLGTGRIHVVATSGKYRAESEVWLEVRAPNVAQTRYERATIAPGASWNSALKGFGLDGTRAASLEVSALPPVNLDGRLQYLITYPHGCIEQTTSGVFPQLYLPALMALTQNQRLAVENHVRAAIARIRSMQHSSGGFSYWPGTWSTDPELDWRNDWGTTYAGHFMLEAEKAGYTLPGDMKSAWIHYQKERAQHWSVHDYDWAGDTRQARVEAARYAQAYRLFTLALAGSPDVGAMNRLRESGPVSIGERWMLASAYKLGGKPEVANQLAERDKLQAFVFTDGNPYTFGSLLRDRAVVLMGLTLLGRDAETNELLDDVSRQLGDDGWYSTQAVAFALVAVAQNAGSKPFKGFTFDYTSGKDRNSFTGESPLASIPLPAPPPSGLPVAVTNTSDRKLYLTASVRAVPRSGEEDSSARGLYLTVTYSDGDGNPVDIRRVPQGMDLIAQVTVKNSGDRAIDNLALTQMVPAGWEIRNDRIENVDTSGERTEAARGSYWWVPSEWRSGQMRSAEYVDIRDDRVLRYFSLRGGESIFFETRLNAAYLGKYYLPGAGIEAMYDATQQARLKGQWIEVVSPQR